jgi:hypothetical protein
MAPILDDPWAKAETFAEYLTRRGVSRRHLTFAANWRCWSGRGGGLATAVAREIAKSSAAPNVRSGGCNPGGTGCLESVLRSGSTWSRN